MTRIRKLLDYSICRLLVGAIMVTGATLGTQFALAWIGSLAGFHASSPSWWGGFEFAASAVAAFFGYWLYAKWIEKRVPEELSPSHRANSFWRRCQAIGFGRILSSSNC
jgi:membrane protein implicated in regulation of membrane protease activity